MSDNSGSSNIVPLQKKDSESSHYIYNKPGSSTMSNAENFFNKDIFKESGHLNRLEEENDMDINFLIKDLKDEMRERDTRTEQRQKDLEDRFVKQEQRYFDDAKEREERFSKLADEIKQATTHLENNNDQTVKAVRANNLAMILAVAAMVITVVVALMNVGGTP